MKQPKVHQQICLGKKVKEIRIFLFILPQCAAVERAGLQKLKRESEGAAVFYFYN